MDAHMNEAAAAAVAMQETYGTSQGHWDGSRRRWSESDPVLFYFEGNICRGHVMRAEYGAEQDTYYIRRHLVGGGTEVVEVRDRAMLVY